MRESHVSSQRHRGEWFALLGCVLAAFACSGAPPAGPTAPGTLASAPASTAVGAASSTPPAPAALRPTATGSALPPLDGLAEIASTMRAPSSTWDLWEIVPTALRPAGDAPLSVFTVSLAKDQRVAWPSDPGVDVIGVVVEGAVKMHPRDDKAAGTPLVVWQGFRAPEANVELVNAGTSTARVVVAVAMNPAGSPLLAHLPTAAPEKAKPRSMFGPSPATPPAPPRSKRVDVIDFPTRRLLTWGSGAYHVRIGVEATSYELTGEGGKTTSVNDAPPAVMDAMVLSNDAPVAAHVHDKEWECIVALVADGDLLIADGPTGATTPVPMRDGSVQCVPPNHLHAWKPSGTKPFVAIQFYAAPGPEQRFKKLAASEQP